MTEIEAIQAVTREQVEASTLADFQAAFPKTGFYFENGLLVCHINNKLSNLLWGATDDPTPQPAGEVGE